MAAGQIDVSAISGTALQGRQCVSGKGAVTPSKVSVKAAGQSRLRRERNAVDVVNAVNPEIHIPLQKYTHICMYVCLYLYVYLFYYVYCVPCTTNRKPVCHFTCGLLTFTEARRDGTSDQPHRLRPACRPDAESLGAAQCQCRLPWHVAFSPLNACRCTAGGRVLSMPCAQCVRRSGSRKSEGVCPAAVCESAPCNRKSYPACMRGGQSANNLQTTGTTVIPSRQCSETGQNLGDCSTLKGFRKCDSTHRKRQLTSYAD